MRKYCYAVVACILALILAVRIGYTYSNKREDVQFEFVGCLSKTKPVQWDYWFMVDDKKGTDFNTSILAEYCDVDSLEMDFEQYTYIVSDGHQLLDLYYIPSDGRRRFSLSPDYYGYAKLQKADDAIYIYRISRDVPMIKDPHAHYEDDFRTTVLQ